MNRKLIGRLIVAIFGVLLVGLAPAQASSRVNVPHAPSGPAADAPSGAGGGACGVTLAVCYYDLCDGADSESPEGEDICFGQGDADQVPPIVAAGHQPVYIEDLDAGTLAGCDILFAQNESNSGYNQEWVDALPALSARVQAGMVLVLHDRAVDDEEVGEEAPAGAGTIVMGNAADFTPGLAGAVCVREFLDDANVDVVTGGTDVTDGPAGTIDDTTLDDGDSSSHGYCEESSLPAGSTNFLSRTVSTQSVAFAYSYGSGTVYYSTMPLDYYLDGEGDDPPRSAYQLIYAPNVITYAAGVSPACSQPLIQEIPTLSPAGLAALAALLGLGSLWALKRRASAAR